MRPSFRKLFDAEELTVAGGAESSAWQTVGAKDAPIGFWVYATSDESPTITLTMDIAYFWDSHPEYDPDTYKTTIDISAGIQKTTEYTFNPPALLDPMVQAYRLTATTATATCTLDAWSVHASRANMNLLNMIHESAQGRVSATIADGASLSGACEPAATPYGLIVPAMTASTVYIRPQGSIDGKTFYPLVDTAGTYYKWTISTSEAIGIVVHPAILRPWKYLKFESVQTDGTTAQNQSGAKEIIVVTQPVA